MKTTICHLGLSGHQTTTALTDTLAMQPDSIRCHFGFVFAFCACICEFVLVFAFCFCIYHYGFKWPSQTITVLTDILHNLIHSAAKFGFYLGISDAPSNANFWMWCHITVICFLITNMALKTTLLLMAFSFLFNFVNVIEGSKSNDEDNREKSHNHSSSGEVGDIVVFVSKI